MSVVLPVRGFAGPAGALEAKFENLPDIAAGLAQLLLLLLFLKLSLA